MAKKFTLIEYIESTGSQWIDTGIIANGNIGFEIDAIHTRIANKCTALICSDDYNGSRRTNTLYLGNNTSGSSRLDVMYGSLIFAISNYQWPTNKTKFSLIQNQLKINDVLQTTFSQYTLNGTKHIWLFAHGWNSYPEQFGISRIYSVKFFKDVSIIFDAIPVKDDNGVVCLYDKVTDTFFYNQGTGDFLGGKEINKKLLKFSVSRKHFDDIPSSGKSVFLVSRFNYENITTGTTFNTNRLNYDIDFDVNFNKNGGTSVSEQSRTYTVGKKYGSFPTATHSDARFLGWYDTVSGTHQVLSTDLADYNTLTLYAKYLPYIGITFNCDGGNFSDGTSSKTLKYAPGYPFSDYTWPSNPTKTGINFAGWYTSRGGAGTKITQSSICPSYTTTYYADWKALSYTVNLNDQWRVCQTWTNKDTRFNVYESNSNYNVSNGYAKMYINLTGYTEFTIYINSYAESNYDYTLAFNQNIDVTSLPSYTTSGVKAYTYGYQYNPSSYTIDSGTGWKKVTYTLDGGTNKIMICYRKDSSVNSNWDRGYVAIPV